ncbi:MULTISPECIES: c-type cytochrome [unclassified Pseudomonas]|uniref:c-type cytochrome n=1 Tax=unclassified Pseudomonas TaxID=196821 RepID=UPI002AC92508|nr:MULTISPECIES: c-type cytochrome [unclassified Pseudomonas]MEB0040024.1 c-type cytochrome [Pseudomonas sp. MH10]MEB0119549.1 c-type cytochrome [Pseudomonas sp. CCI1.2]WPX65154.1 c-type cytochrome [Pseudomonas sp. MH10]
MSADIHPGTTSGTTNNYRDVRLDATYQYLGTGRHVFTLNSSLIRETQNLGASLAAGLDCPLMTARGMNMLKSKTTTLRYIWMITCLAATGLTPVARAADATAGAKSYDAHCARCHSLANPLKNKKGPGLFGVSGRAAGSAPGYRKYSEAMKTANLTWTPDKLDAYVTNSRAMLPGTTMKFKGISEPKERADLVEFLSKQK